MKEFTEVMASIGRGFMRLFTIHKTAPDDWLARNGLVAIWESGICPPSITDSDYY